MKKILQIISQIITNLSSFKYILPPLKNIDFSEERVFSYKRFHLFNEF